MLIALLIASKVKFENNLKNDVEFQFRGWFCGKLGCVLEYNNFPFL